MNRLILTLLIANLLVISSCTSKKSNQEALPRIAIAGIAIESSTFSPAVTHEEAFKAKEGDSVFTYYPFFCTRFGSNR